MRAGHQQRTLVAEGAIGWRCGWGRRVLALVALATMYGGLCSGAIASPLRLLAPSTIAFSSDGARYAAWQVRKGSAIVVFDTRTGHRAAISPPAGCELYDHNASDLATPAAAGRFLLACSEGSALLDVGSGAVKTLPSPMGPFNSGWVAVGGRYVEWTADQHACRQTSSEGRRRVPCTALYDIATGVVSYRPESQLPDLDRRGAPPICRTLREKLIALRIRTPQIGRAHV
jgi:hypothetical protein